VIGLSRRAEQISRRNTANTRRAPRPYPYGRSWRYAYSRGYHTGALSLSSAKMRIKRVVLPPLGSVRDVHQLISRPPGLVRRQRVTVAKTAGAQGGGHSSRPSAIAGPDDKAGRRQRESGHSARPWPGPRAPGAQRRGRPVSQPGGTGQVSSPWPSRTEPSMTPPPGGQEADQGPRVTCPKRGPDLGRWAVICHASQSPPGSAALDWTFWNSPASQAAGGQPASARRPSGSARSRSAAGAADSAGSSRPARPRSAARIRPPLRSRSRQASAMSGEPAGPGRPGPAAADPAGRTWPASPRPGAAARATRPRSRRARPQPPYRGPPAPRRAGPSRARAPSGLRLIWTPDWRPGWVVSAGVVCSPPTRVSPRSGAAGAAHADSDTGPVDPAPATPPVCPMLSPRYRWPQA
jgi:hypothetical protein